MIKKGAHVYFLHCYAIDDTTKEEKNDDPKKLDKILGKHNTIFQEIPRGLPPPRSRDHIIELIPGCASIRKNSYRQSHQHKT
jgi:hypothetical protein